MADKMENSGETSGTTESEEGFVFVEGSETKRGQNDQRPCLDRPVESASQLTATKQDENHPKLDKDDGAANDMYKDTAAKETVIPPDVQTEIDFSKWKLEKIGEYLCLKTDTGIVHLPQYFWGKSIRLHVNKGTAFLTSSEGDALEVRRETKDTFMFIRTRLTVSDTDKDETRTTLDESFGSQSDNLEKNQFKDSAVNTNSAGKAGKDEERKELNKNTIDKMKMTEENQGDKSDLSIQPVKMKDSVQISIPAMLTTLDSKEHVQEKIVSERGSDENVFPNINSANGDISYKQEIVRDTQQDDGCQDSSFTSANGINQKEVKAVICDDVSSTSMPKKAVGSDTENHEFPDSGLPDNYKQQISVGIENYKDSDRKPFGNGNQLEEQFATERSMEENLKPGKEMEESPERKKTESSNLSRTEQDKMAESREEGGNASEATKNAERKFLIAAKVDEVETVIEEMRNLKLEEQKVLAEGAGGEHKTVTHGNLLKDSDQLPCEKAERQVNEYTVSPFLDMIVEHAKQQEDTQHLFSGIEISFKERGKVLVCVLKKEPDIPDSVVDKILSLHENCGRRDVGFRDIRHFDNVKDKEGMLNALLTDISKKQEFLWKIDAACKKIFIATSAQPAADTLCSEIKGGLDVRNFFLPGSMNKERYAKQLLTEINETYGDRVQVYLDPDVWLLKLLGLQKSVAAALGDFQIISKSVYVNCSDKLKFIESELEKGIFASDTKLVQIERKENKEKRGFVLHGPSKQVSFLFQKIDEILNDCVINDVGITDYASLSYLSSSAGEEFVNTMASRQNVTIDRNWSSEVISRDLFPPKTHTLPTGHQIVLTSLSPTGPKVNFEVPEYSTALSTFVKKEDSIVVQIPKYNDGMSKEKEKFEGAMKQLLKLMEERGFFQVSVCLEEVGGWRITKLVRNVLYGLKEHMDTSLKLPSTVCLTPLEKYKEAEMAFSDAFPDLEFDDSHYNNDDSQTKLNIDAWKSDLLQIQADVLVYAVHPSLDLKQGNISGVLDARAGPQLQAELKDSFKGRKLKPWEFTCTNGYKLPYKFVLHGALEEYKNFDSLKDIQNFIYRCLEKAEELKVRRIVFPALGTGRCRYKNEDIATAICEASMCFEMKFPMSSLRQVTIAIPDNEAHYEISKQLQTRHESKLLMVGKVLMRARLISQGTTAVMADSVVVFWEMKNFSTLRVHESPFLVKAGSSSVLQSFTKHRDMKTCGRTFVTDGGNFYPKQIVHVPYNDDENKLESAFEDGIEKVDNKHCSSCILYFTENSPMLKHRDKMMFYLLRAVRNLSQKLVNVKYIVVVIEGDNQTFLRWFEKSAESLGLEGQKQGKSVATQFTPEINQTIKITGLEENVKRAKQELEDKIAKLQESKVVKESPMVSAPGEMDISRKDRGLPDDLHHREQAGSSYEASGYSSKTAGGEQSDDIKLLKKSEASVTHENLLGGAAKEDKKLEATHGHDTQQWRSSMLVHDESFTDSLCVEVGNIDGGETWDNLIRKLNRKKGVPVKCPDLIYPFENRQKALLICQSTEDADKLDGYTLESHPFTFTKFNPQCLQMMKVTIPSKHINSLKEMGVLEKLVRQLDEIGVVEPSKAGDDSSVNVTVFTLSQMKVLQEVLQNFEDKTTKKEIATGDITHTTRRPVKGPASGDVTHTAGRPEKSSASDSASLTSTEHKSSSSESDMNKIELLATNVGEMFWKVFRIQNSYEVEKLVWQNVHIGFEDDSIIMDGHTDEIRINLLKQEIDKLTKLQMEEIKPTTHKTKFEFDQWCTDFSTAIGKPCCVYDDESKSFIAFGETYEDISKVKHQLNIKQGIIKQTGRRKNRNLDSSTPSVMDLDTGPCSMPSFPTSMSVPKHGYPDFTWSKDANQVQDYKTNEGIKVYVYVANILRLPVDCIVNAANETLQHGGGVAAVIANAAGYELTREGNRHVKTNGVVPVGKAFTTTAGKLPYDCVIHAVGPRWSDYMPHTYQNVKNCESFLQNAILSSFTEAENRSLKTIAIPAISSAIFSVPEEMCAVQYAKAILNYSSGNATNSDRLKEIHFIDKNPSIIRLIQKTFKTMIEDQKETDYDIMKYVTKTSPGYGNASGYSRSIRRTADTRDMGKTLPVFEETSEGCVLHAENSSRVVVYDGNILEAHKKHITCIVCADDNTGRGKGGLANALMSNSRGFSYGMDKHEAFNCKWPKEGDLVISSGKGTGYENVLHAVLWGTGRATDQKGVVLEAYKNILKESSWRKFSTVAIPILGTGSYKAVTIEESTEAFVMAYLDFCTTTKTGSKLRLYLVCQNPSNRNKVISVIRGLLQTEDKPPEPAPKKARDSSLDTGDTKSKDTSSEDTDKTCAICMDDISSPKSLPCGHTFCANCINNYLDNYKKACPTCGKVCGIIEGDQPDGKMTVTTNNYSHCAGYENVGRIDITYSFPDGLQKEGHPDPGNFYHGITRTAYLPDNKEGNEIQTLLQIAFERKLVFTIGRSRTTGKEGVITWNDIHHKTNPHPHGNFGYPDPGYFERVKDELAAKGVTVDDIPQLSGNRSGNRGARGRRH